MSHDGSIIAIGARDTGLVRVYKYASDTWTQLGSDVVGGTDQSGMSISLSSNGTVLAIGGWQAYSGRGRVRVLRLSAGGWMQIGGDIIGDEIDGTAGYSVNLSSDGSVVALGAHHNDRAGYSVGQVKVNWRLLGSNGTGYIRTGG